MRSWHRWMGTAGLAGALSCAGTQASDPRVPDAQRPSSTAEASAAPRPGSGPLVLSPAEPGPFEASALAPLAEQLVALARAALDGGPLPSELPLEQPLRRDALVKAEEALPALAELDFFVLGVEVCLAFGGETPDDSGDDSGVTAGLVLTRAGVKVAFLGGCARRNDAPLPEWLRGVEQTSRDLARALDDGSIRDLLIGEADRPAIGSDVLFGALMQERPTLSRIDRARRKSAGKYRGASLPELVLVARDRAGEIWGVQFDIGDRGGQIVLRSSPLIEVERLRPPEARTHERS